MFHVDDGVLGEADYLAFDPEDAPHLLMPPDEPAGAADTRLSYAPDRFPDPANAVVDWCDGPGRLTGDVRGLIDDHRLAVDVQGGDVMHFGDGGMLGVGMGAMEYVVEDSVPAGEGRGHGRADAPFVPGEYQTHGPPPPPLETLPYALSGYAQDWGLGDLGIPAHAATVLALVPRNVGFHNVLALPAAGPDFVLCQLNMREVIWYQRQVMNPTVMPRDQWTHSQRRRYQMLLLNGPGAAPAAGAAMEGLPVFDNTSGARRGAEAQWEARITPAQVEGMVGAGGANTWLYVVYPIHGGRVTYSDPENPGGGIHTVATGGRARYVSLLPLTVHVARHWLDYAAATRRRRKFDDHTEETDFRQGIVDMYAVDQVPLYACVPWPIDMRSGNIEHLSNDVLEGRLDRPVVGVRGLYSRSSRSGAAARAGGWFPAYLSLFDGAPDSWLTFLSQRLDVYVSRQHYLQAPHHGALSIATDTVACFYKAVTQTFWDLHEIELAELRGWLLGVGGTHAVNPDGVIDIAQARRIIDRIVESTAERIEGLGLKPLLFVFVTERSGTPLHRREPMTPRGWPRLKFPEYTYAGRGVVPCRLRGVTLPSRRVVTMGLVAGHWFPVMSTGLARHDFLQYLTDGATNPRKRELALAHFEVALRSVDISLSLTSFDMLRYIAFYLDKNRPTVVESISMNDVLTKKDTYEDMNTLSRPPANAVYTEGEMNHMVKRIDDGAPDSGSAHSDRLRRLRNLDAHYVIDYEDTSQDHVPYMVAAAFVDLNASSPRDIHTQTFFIAPGSPVRGDVFRRFVLPHSRRLHPDYPVGEVGARDLFEWYVNGGQWKAAGPGVKKMPPARNIGLWAHNMTYDFRHMAADATAAGGFIMPDTFLQHHGKVVSVAFYFPEWNLMAHFRDSWRLMGPDMSVKKMPKAFGFDSDGLMKKELFLHDWMADGSLHTDYPTFDSPVPIARLREIVDKGLLDGKALTPFPWDDFLVAAAPFINTEEGTIRLFRYAQVYCAQDVVITAFGLLTFAKRVGEMTAHTVDALQCLSASSIADRYFKASRVYEGCVALNGLLGGFFRQFAVGGRCASAWNYTALRPAADEQVLDQDARSLYPSAMLSLSDVHGGFLRGHPRLLSPVSHSTMADVVRETTWSGWFVQTRPLDSTAPAPIFYPLGLYPLIPSRDATERSCDEDGEVSAADGGASMQWINDLRAGAPGVPSILHWDIISFHDYLLHQRGRYSPTDFHVIGGYYFTDGRTPVVRSVVQQLYAERLAARDPALKVVLKLLLNSAYGKLLEHPPLTRVRVEDDPKRMLDFVNSRHHLVINASPLTGGDTPHWGVTLRSPYAVSYSRPHLAAEVLSMSKALMNRLACSVVPRCVMGLDRPPRPDEIFDSLETRRLPWDVIIYTDTDSLHMTARLWQNIVDTLTPTSPLPLDGDQMLQYHSDFPDSGPTQDALYVSKKIYCVTFATPGTPPVCALKGVPMPALLHAAGLTTLSNGVMDVYERLARGEPVPFDLEITAEGAHGNKRAFFCVDRWRTGFAMQTVQQRRVRVLSISPSGREDPFDSSELPSLDCIV